MLQHVEVLVLKLAAVDRLAARPVHRREVAALHHEALDHAVEGVFLKCSSFCGSCRGRARRCTGSGNSRRSAAPRRRRARSRSARAPRADVQVEEDARIVVGLMRRLALVNMNGYDAEVAAAASSPLPPEDAARSRRP